MKYPVMGFTCGLFMGGRLNYAGLASDNTYVALGTVMLMAYSNLRFFGVRNSLQFGVAFMLGITLSIALKVSFEPLGEIFSKAIESSLWFLLNPRDIDPTNIDLNDLNSTQINL